jgi:hypothetical protein
VFCIHCLKYSDILFWVEPWGESEQSDPFEEMPT